MNEGDWYAPPGTEVHYNNIKNERNPYNIDYYRKTKIPFFKGPEDQEKFINYFNKTSYNYSIIDIFHDKNIANNCILVIKKNG